jgi:hypothetical protein
MIQFGNNFGVIQKNTWNWRCLYETINDVISVTTMCVRDPTQYRIIFSAWMYFMLIDYIKKLSFISSPEFYENPTWMGLEVCRADKIKDSDYIAIQERESGETIFALMVAKEDLHLIEFEELVSTENIKAFIDQIPTMYPSLSLSYQA